MLSASLLKAELLAKLTQSTSQRSAQFGTPDLPACRLFCGSRSPGPDLGFNFEQREQGCSLKFQSEARHFKELLSLTTIKNGLKLQVP